MLIDRARVRVAGGQGGNGCCSFRREKYVPRGGPDGGDGGKGGDVYFVVDPRQSSLLDVKFHSEWRGESGVHGKGSDRHGKNGGDVFIRVPPGTQVMDFETGELLADLTESGQRFLAARGGRGGKGNARFATSTRRAPRFAEKGEPGQQAEYLLELKLIAEAGLVGLPNAGKSTLLARVTAANPKIGDYPFTTVSPNLGVARLSDHRTLTLADIPGIIEGAAEGKGLGHDFLRHIERTMVLVFVIDLGDANPAGTRAVLEAELEQYSPELAGKPKVFALNKADMTENRARFDEVKCDFDDPHLISGVTGEGVSSLLEHVWALVSQAREEEAITVPAEPERDYTYIPPFTIVPTPEGFVIEGKTIERIAQMTDFDNEEALFHFQTRLRKLGILKALKRMGAQEGQSIVIGDIEFEYEPD